LAELVCFNHGPDAHVVAIVFRNFFYARYSGPTGDKCVLGLREFPVAA